ncbi:MAG: four helix bundle protein [bacterium]
MNEATAAPTKKDFINKMSIASKESRETIYRLKLLQESNITQTDCLKYIEEVEEIIRIITSIVKTSQSNLP